MALNKSLLVKSMFASLLITVLLMVMAFLPIWSILTVTEKSVFPVYVLMK